MSTGGMRRSSASSKGETRADQQCGTKAYCDARPDTFRIKWQASAIKPARRWTSPRGTDQAVNLVLNFLEARRRCWALCDFPNRKSDHRRQRLVSGGCGGVRVVAFRPEPAQHFRDFMLIKLLGTRHIYQHARAKVQLVTQISTPMMTRRSACKGSRNPLPQIQPSRCCGCPLEPVLDPVNLAAQVMEAAEHLALVRDLPEVGLKVCDLAMQRFDFGFLPRLEPGQLILVGGQFGAKRAKLAKGQVGGFVIVLICHISTMVAVNALRIEILSAPTKVKIRMQTI